MMVSEKKEKQKKKKTSIQIASTIRKCLYCNAINHLERKKCRRCFLTLQAYPELKDTGVGKIYSVMLNDPRPSYIKLVDYVEVFAGVMIGIIFLMNLLGKSKFSDGYLPMFHQSIPFIVIGIAYVMFRQYMSIVCRSCGKVMVIRVPIRKQYFPQSVRCWACGAIHTIDWDFQRSDKIKYMS